MKKIRNIPFGYMMKNGRYITEPSESEAVTQIFKMYLNGMSLKDIADVMTVPYNADKQVWTLNMVKRIIENKKYIGTSEYPQIVDKATFDAVRAIADERYDRIKMADDETKMLRSMIKGKKPRISTAKIRTAILQIINSLIFDPTLAALKGNYEYRPSVKTIAAEDKIKAMMQDLDADTEQLERLILEAASLRYDDCPYDNRDKTIPILDILARHKPSTELDIELVKKIVKYIIIDNGTISAELVNGVIIPSQGE